MVEGLVPSLQFLWELFWTWGWIFLPFFLWPILSFHWLFWRGALWDERKNPSMLLELRFPEEIQKPMRAMELVLSGFWQIYGPPNWFEKWWEGQGDLSFSFEIAAIEGVPHFLLRIPKKQRDLFETHIYAHYPDVEIYEVEDYTAKVPANIPNQRWNMWGTDYTMPKSDVYPIKTYRDFENESETREERKIDPLAPLIEGLSKLGKGEQIWIQIKAKPITDENDGSNFQKRSKKEYEKIAGRKESPPPPPLWKEVIRILKGEPEKKEEKKDVFPEMMLTPMERDVVASIERKRTKHLFECFIRYLYVYKQDSFSGSRIKLPMSFFNQFNTTGLGFMIPWELTKVKQNWYDFFWFLEKRLYIKKRAKFRNYKRRVPSYFPMDKPEATFVLSNEELASLFHPPSRVSVPPSVIQRVGSRKKEAPFGLPTEEE